MNITRVSFHSASGKNETMKIYRKLLPVSLLATLILIAPSLVRAQGQDIESMPPVGLPNEFAVILDRALAGDSVLYFTGGEARAVLKIRGKDLARATRAKVARIAGPASSPP